MMENRKLIIFSSSYPYGLKETFLHNEVLFLSKYFDIEIFPLIKSSQEAIPVKLPNNVVFHQPLLERNYAKRLIKSIFNQSPILPHFKDLILIFKSPDNLRSKLTRWLLHMITFRTLYSSKELKEIKLSSTQTIYFYWANIPIKLIEFINKEVFIRVHGGEVDMPRNHGYIPLLNYNITKRENVTYLPISKKAAQDLHQIENVKLLLSRIGVFDNGLNPYNEKLEIIRIVSCSNLIRLKRVHLIIEALSLIKDKKVEWIHFGDGPLLDELKKLGTGLSTNVNAMFMGRVKNSEIIKFYSLNQVDLLINVSDTEGVPVSIMEAFSFGIPCFATDVGGTKEIVNQTNGYLAVKEFQIYELANFVLNIKEQSAKDNLRAGARKTFEECCSAENNFKRLVEIFNQ